MRVAVFSTKPYDRQFLEAGNAAAGFPHEFAFLEARLSVETAGVANGSNDQRRSHGSAGGASRRRQEA
jgi:D-lactate dehydrogenase